MIRQFVWGSKFYKHIVMAVRMRRRVEFARMLLLLSP